MKKAILVFSLFLCLGAFARPIRITTTVTVCDEASLRAAVSNGGTVNFGCDGTIVLSSTLQITTNLVLDGTGHNVVLSGGNQLRVLFVATNVDLTIKNLTIANGKQQGTNGNPAVQAFGAGIFIDGGRVVLDGSSISNNIAVGGNGGAGLSSAAGSGIYNNGGSLTISNSLLAGNSCLGASGGNASGAALYSKGGTVIIAASEIRNNSVFGSPPVSVPVGPFNNIFVGSGLGGALFFENGLLSISQTRFLNNQANGGAAPADLGNSGSTGPAQGGAAFFTNTTATISLCQFLTNNAISPDEGGRFSVSSLAQGGAIFNAGTLDLIDTYFAGNGSQSVRYNEADGGAIYNAAQLTICRSTIAGNAASGGRGLVDASGLHEGSPARGGGIYNRGDLFGTNCTLTANQAVGGMAPTFPPSNIHSGDAEGGGVFSEGKVTLDHFTVALNAVQSERVEGSNLGGPLPGLKLGAGIFTTNGPAILQNTILANNLSGSNSFGVLIDDGNNLSSDTSSQFTAPGSFNNTDPLLSSLDDYGGPTPTMALLTGSPAIDHGFADWCPATDQRGIARPFASGCDIGAFEFSPRLYPLNTLTVAGYTNQILHLIFAGTNGQKFQLITSTNFVDWIVLQTNQIGARENFDCFQTNDLDEPFRFFQTVGF